MEGRLSVKHIFKRGANPEGPTLLLLHGTGGDEHDLLPLADTIDSAASVLSVRGNVLEGTMSRFFRRVAEGVFDEEDLVFRTTELKEFVDKASRDYGFDRAQVVAVGYSNGANIAASMLFHIPGSLMGAALHHPMVPRRGIELPDLKGVAVFIGAGRNDPLCPAQESEDLQALLEGAGATVAMHWENSGHRLTATEVQAAAAWYRERFVAGR